MFTSAGPIAVVGFLAMGLPVAATTATAPVSSNVNRVAAVPRVGNPVSNRIPGTRCRAFPANNYWHADVSRLPVHPRSGQWLASASNRNLHPDFGPSFGEQPVPYGIPITIDRSRRPRAAVRFGYASESDKVRYPLRRTTKIEGGWRATGDRHAIVIHARSCRLYETWDTHLTKRGWYAGSGAVWSLRSNALRPPGWTSADAAGLPILPGLLRWDEVVRGRVDHAIRFTLARTQHNYLWPARHRAGSTSSQNVAPMGARFRLKSSFATSGFSSRARVVLDAMKRYGLVLADNGSDWYFQGTADRRWPIRLVNELKRIPSSEFEAVDTSPLLISEHSAQARR